MKQLLPLIVGAIVLATMEFASAEPNGTMVNGTMNINGSLPFKPGPNKGAKKPPKIGGISFAKGGVKMKDIKSLGAGGLGTALKSMSQDEQDTVCQGVMNGGADKKTMDAIKAAGVDCIGAMRRDPNFKPKGGQARMAVEQMRADKAPKDWGKDDWSVVFKQMPGAVKASDIRAMGKQTLKDLVKSGDLTSNKDAFKKPSERRALEEQLQTAYGKPSAWNNESLNEMGALLPKMDIKSLRQIPPSAMKDAAASFMNMEFDDPGKKAAIGEQLIAGLGKDSANSWSGDDVKAADQFIRKNPKIIGKLSDSAIKGALTGLGARATDKRGAAQLGKRLKSMSEYSDPTKIDSTKIEEMGNLMKGMGRGYLKKMTKTNIEGALSTLSNVTFPRGEARELMQQIKGTMKSYSADKVKELGHLVTGLDPSDLDDIPDSAIADSIDDLKDKDFDKSQCRAILKKVKAAGGSNLKKVGPLMQKCGSPDDVESVSIEDMGLSCSDNTAPTFTPDKAMAKKLMKMVKKQFGAPASDNTNYTLTCIQNWGAVAALGMDPEDYENMPDNGDLASIFEAFSDFEGDMDEMQTKGIAKRVRQFLDPDNQTAAEAFDATLVAQVGRFMKHFNDSDLEKFNSTMRPEIATEIANGNMDKMPTSEITRLKKFALKHVLRDDTSKVTDRSGEATLDDNDIRGLAGLHRGLEKADIDKMSGDAISANIGEMNDKIRGKDNMKAIWARMENQDSTFKNSSDSIIGAAGLVGGLSTTLLNDIDKSVLGEALSDASATIEGRQAEDDKRDDAGFKDEVSDTDKAELAANLKTFIQKAFEGYQDSQSSKRRRRATVATTCADVQTLGSNANILTSTQIESLTTDEFTDCTETMGAITSWSSTQLASLISEAKAAYGTDVSTWSAANVKLIGTINAGLTVAEIGTLKITGADTLAVMGTSSSFSSTQLAAGFSRFLSQVRSGTASSVTGDDLISLGAFACGATSAQIGSFTAANYKSAASAIGSQSACDSTQLTAYATLAKSASAYGAASTWDSTTITTVGSVIGGLTTAEIGALSSTQISNISPSTMALIPPTAFAGFTTTQLSGFSSSQANSVTKSQQASLSLAQLTSLTSAGATVKTTGSGAASIRATILCLAPILAVYLL